MPGIYITFLVRVLSTRRHAARRGEENLTQQG